ncbi:MAG TPA: acetylglutamate kinase [Clostridiaceae bacterium]|nr:acetylglutamate kinase [Clostridiaceae bacterium]
MEDKFMKTIIKRAEILIEALPYIQKLYGKTIVIKYGGNAMINDELKNYVMEDIILLKYVGMNPVVVHGGGPDLTHALERLDIKSEFVNGLRVTTAEIMEVAQMVFIGKTNKEIVSLLNLKGAKAIGLSGIDGNLIECEKLTMTTQGEHIDLGYVGKITNIDSKLIELLAADEYIPIIAPIGIGKDGQSYNINADTVASEVASALKAEKLILLTDVEGVKTADDNGVENIITTLTIHESNELIDEKIINGGMIPKVLGCIDALNNGVTRTHIIDGRVPHCILLEIFTDEGIGTMIVR